MGSQFAEIGCLYNPGDRRTGGVRLRPQSIFGIGTYNSPRPKRMQRLIRLFKAMLRFQNIEAGSRARTTSAAMFSALENN